MIFASSNTCQSAACYVRIIAHCWDTHRTLVQWSEVHFLMLHFIGRLMVLYSSDVLSLFLRSHGGRPICLGFEQMKLYKLSLSCSAAQRWVIYLSLVTTISKQATCRSASNKWRTPSGADVAHEWRSTIAEWWHGATESNLNVLVLLNGVHRTLTDEGKEKERSWKTLRRSGQYGRQKQWIGTSGQTLANKSLPAFHPRLGNSCLTIARSTGAGVPDETVMIMPFSFSRALSLLCIFFTVPTITFGLQSPESYPLSKAIKKESVC